MREQSATVRAELYGARLKAQAEHKGVTARQLAEMLGVTESAVSRWYAGAREMTDDYRICCAAQAPRRAPARHLSADDSETGELVA